MMRRVTRRTRIDRCVVAVCGVVLASAMASAHSSAWINEVHYNNDGTDVGEFVEIAGEAGIDLTGWSLVLYNGTNGQVYNTAALSGTLSDITGTGFGFTVVNYPTNGIQNGIPDGMALVDPFGCVVELISYGGVFTAVEGAATGRESVDIGVNESGVTPIGFSLQLTGAGIERESFTWATEALSTSGSANQGQSFVEPVCDGDANNDGLVDFSDINAVLGNWLNSCP